jgi:putative flippase GtrA
MENTFPSLTRKDYFFGAGAGFLIGLLILPVLQAGQPLLFENYAILFFLFFLIATPLGIIVAHLISKKIMAIWQFAKFGVTGVLNLLVDLGTLSLITLAFRNYLGITSQDLVFSGSALLTFYSIFKASSFIIANINSYYWNKYWTFEKKSDTENSETGSKFFQFLIVSLLGWAINVLIATLVVRLAPFSGLSLDQIGLLGAMAGSICGLAWNFIGYKFIVFK